MKRKLSDARTQNLYWWVPLRVAPQSFQLRAGEDNLREYLFNKHAIHHQLCTDCGVDVFARGSKPDGTEAVALNVSCIDGIELTKLKMTPIDGRNR